MNVSPTELFTKPIRVSSALFVSTLGLATLNDCVPASSPIAESTSIGLDTFEPFTTNIDITKDCAAERFSVNVWPGPTVGFFAYQIWDRRSNPVPVFVGPATEIQVLLKLSEGVIVTPACDEAKTTIASPPVLSNGAVVCVVSAVELM